MIKYYTRACNFYYGKLSRKLVKKKKTLPLCGNNSTSFDKLEIFKKNKKKISSKIIDLNNINSLLKLLNLTKGITHAFTGKIVSYFYY